MTPEETEIAAGISAELQAGAFERGRQSVLDPAAARALAHDTGYGATQGHRAFIQAVIEGYEAGCQARKELAARLTEPRKEAEAA